MRKTINLLVTLLLLFSMGVVVHVQGAVALADPVYDERYVSMMGSDATGTGTQANPWRTITYAESKLPYGGANPDRINVLPSNALWYGGAVPENIVVDKPVTIKSTDGAAVTKIDVTGQVSVPDCVIEIVTSNVVIDGLFLTGAATGVCAHPLNENDYIENVQVINCVIKIDQFKEGVGIDMLKVKYPYICDNQIKVGTEGAGLALSVANAYGIILFDCPPKFDSTKLTEVCRNTIDIHGDFEAEGIGMELCPKALVRGNIVRCLAAGDVEVEGIEAEASPLVQIVNNRVTIEGNGNGWVEAEGIEVEASDKAVIASNNVTVNANLVGNTGGWLEAMGIKLEGSSEGRIHGNIVKVNGTGNVNASAVALAMSEETAQDLADINEVLTEILGASFNGASGWGMVVGIDVVGSPATTVAGNDVDVVLDLKVISGSEDIAVASGMGIGCGIMAMRSSNAQIMGNAVDVDADVELKVTAIDAAAAEIGAGGGLSVALGIALCGCPCSAVGENTVRAEADQVITVKSVPTASAAETTSALARFDANVMPTIYEALRQAIENESIDANLSGTLPTIESFANAGGLAAGLGILVVKSDETMVGRNNVLATGDVNALVYSKESDNSDSASGIGGALGIGGGVVVIDSRSMQVVANTITANGTAMADIGVVHDPPDAGALSAFALGGGAGIGVGILLVGLPMYDNEAQALPEAESWKFRPVVANNDVVASGVAKPVKVSAIDLLPSHESLAIAGGLGVGLGISALFYPCIVIDGNTVQAKGDAAVDCYSQAVHEFDPASIGGAAGIGVGISTVCCFKAAITNNQAEGTGVAMADVGAVERVIQSANALAGSIGFGEGILVAFSPVSLVKGNCVANGFGDAEADVVAISYIPLGEAFAFDLAAGVGNGIGVVCSPCTSVVECNTAAGEGSARVTSSAQADFSKAVRLGVAADIDILKVLFKSPYPTAEWVRFEFGPVSYNSMIDRAPLGQNSDKVLVFDAGLLNIGPGLDARFNWWNHPTGPSGMGPGQGEPVISIGGPVCFEPWLYVEHCRVLADQLGYFGFFIPMVKGLNTLSTPIALEETVVPSRKWSDIIANSGLGGKIKYAYRWDSPSQAWALVGASDNVDPLDAMYIYLYSPANVILMVNVDRNHPYAMPTRQLSADWNLIAVNPLFPRKGMMTDEALSSIEETPAGLPGYTQVISPIVGGQPAWIYTPSSEPQFMISGRGYWVWMENADILAGFGFTPLPDKLH